MSGSVWQVGDALLWNPTAMDSVYTAAQIALEPNAGTVNLAVRDCAGNAVAG